MTEYRVTWEIDVTAEDAEDAARQALKIQRDPHSLATTFTVARIDTVTVKDRKPHYAEMAGSTMCKCGEKFMDITMLHEHIRRANERERGGGR